MAEISAQQLHELAELADLLTAREYIMDPVLPGGAGSPPLALDVYDDRMGRRAYVGQASRPHDWQRVEDAYYQRRRGPGWKAYAELDP